jgi:hypothetical protein
MGRIGEPRRDFLFIGEFQVVVEQPVEVLEIDPMGARDDGDHHALAAAQQNALGQGVAGDVRLLCDARRGYGEGVLDEIEGDLAVAKIFSEFFRHGHGMTPFAGCQRARRN